MGVFSCRHLKCVGRYPVCFFRTPLYCCWDPAESLHAWEELARGVCREPEGAVGNEWKAEEPEWQDPRQRPPNQTAAQGSEAPIAASWMKNSHKLTLLERSVIWGFGEEKLLAADWTTCPIQRCPKREDTDDQPLGTVDGTRWAVSWLCRTVPFPRSRRIAEMLPALLGCLNSLFMMVPQGLQSEVAQSHSRGRLLPRSSELQQHFSWRQNSSLKENAAASLLNVPLGSWGGLQMSSRLWMLKGAVMSSTNSQRCPAAPVPAARECEVSCGCKAGHTNQLVS